MCRELRVRQPAAADAYDPAQLRTSIGGPDQRFRVATYEIYRNLSDWLLTKTESEIEERYIGLGARRARQGVPFSHFFWAVCATKEYLWEYLQREGLMEEPVEFWGEMELLHVLEQFFDSALYFALIGYEGARKDEVAQALVGHGSGHRSM
jgi:hypothetical protein